MPLKPSAFIFWITSRQSEGLGRRKGCISPDQTTTRLPSIISDCASHSTFFGRPAGAVAAAKSLRASATTLKDPAMAAVPASACFGCQLPSASRLSAYQPRVPAAPCAYRRQRPSARRASAGAPALPAQSPSAVTVHGPASEARARQFDLAAAAVARGSDVAGAVDGTKVSRWPASRPRSGAGADHAEAPHPA